MPQMCRLYIITRTNAAYFLQIPSPRYVGVSDSLCSAYAHTLLLSGRRIIYIYIFKHMSKAKTTVKKATNIAYIRLLIFETKQPFGQPLGSKGRSCHAFVLKTYLKFLHLSVGKAVLPLIPAVFLTLRSCKLSKRQPELNLKSINMFHNAVNIKYILLRFRSYHYTCISNAVLIHFNMPFLSDLCPALNIFDFPFL